MRRRGFLGSRGRGFPVSRRHQTYDGSGLDGSGCLSWFAFFVVGTVVVIAYDANRPLVTGLGVVAAVLIGGATTVAAARQLRLRMHRRSVARAFEQALASRGITLIARAYLGSDYSEFKRGQLAQVGLSTGAMWLTDGTAFASLVRPLASAATLGVCCDPHVGQSGGDWSFGHP
jgi:hypothetical protein